MMHSRCRLAALPGLMLLIGLAVAALNGHREQAPVYRVDALVKLLALDPEVWVGKTVRVRGITQACVPSGSVASRLHCQSRPQEIRDAGSGDANDVLPLAWSTEPSWLAFLRRMPVLGTLLPAAQAPHWGVEAIYRAQLHAVPAASCTALPCFQVVLLDAAP